MCSSDLSEGAAGSPPFYGESSSAMKTFKSEVKLPNLRFRPVTHSLLSFESLSSQVRLDP